MSVWDKLSVEIYDEIFSHIGEPVTDSKELTGRYRWQSGPELGKFDFICGAGQPDYGRYFRRRDLELRLVCKAFDRAMTRAYFNVRSAVFRAYEENALERLQEYVINERAVIAPQVTRLQIVLSPGSYRNSLFEKRNEGEGLNKSKGSAASVYSFVHRLEEALPKLLKLKRLVVDVHEVCRSSGPIYIDSDDEEEKEKHGPYLDLELLSLIRSTISRIFSPPHIDLRLLTDLRLTLFSAYDLATIGTHISNDLANQLRHLYLEYTDGTGPGGDLDYTHHWQGDEDSDGDEDMPYSNLQRRFPNTKYMAAVCAFISRCHNLKSLGLKSTQCINLATLDWKPTSTGLEGLYISRAVATISQLISLCSPSLITFDINDVQLFDNTWGAVFDHLSSCPKLDYLHVWNLVYARAGESAELREWNNRPWENVSVIWSEHEDDERSLFRLHKRVEKRGGVSGVDLECLDCSDDDDMDDEE